MKRSSNLRNILIPTIVSPDIDALRESLNPSSADERYKKKMRTCLSCNKKFMSKSCGHRFCKRCKPKLNTHAGSVPVVKSFDDMVEVGEEMIDEK